MIKKYYCEIDSAKQEELDFELFEYGMEEYVWWEDQNQVIATDNEKVIDDLEKVLEDLNIEYTAKIYED